MAEPLPSWQYDVRALRQFARIRLIVADLDGTVVVPTSDALSRMIQALNRKLSFSSQHVSFTIATGRALAGVAPLMKQLRLRPNVPIAAYNGGLVVLPDRWPPLSRETIPQDSFAGLLRIAAAASLPVLAYSYGVSVEGNALLQFFGEEVYGWRVAGTTERELNGLPITRVAASEAPAGLQPNAVLLEVGDVAAHIRHWLRADLAGIPGISVTQSSHQYVEIRPAGTSKGRAVALIAASLGLCREEVLAIGDNDNDVEMLEWAGVGVAVAGASPAALQSSSYFCRHGVESGVVEVLRTVRQAKRFDRFFRRDNADVR